MDKEAAGIEAERRNKNHMDKWCPLSGGFCKNTCVVFQKAQVVEFNDHAYGVKDGYCDAYSLTGPM